MFQEGKDYKCYIELITDNGSVDNVALKREAAYRQEWSNYTVSKKFPPLNSM